MKSYKTMFALCVVALVVLQLGSCEQLKRSENVQHHQYRLNGQHQGSPGEQQHGYHSTTHTGEPYRPYPDFHDYNQGGYIYGHNSGHVGDYKSNGGQAGRR